MESVIDGHGHFSLARVSGMIGTGCDHAQRAILPAKGDHGQTLLWLGCITKRANHFGRRGRFRKKPVAFGCRGQAVDEALQFFGIARLGDAQDRGCAITQNRTT